MTRTTTTFVIAVLSLLLVNARAFVSPPALAPSMSRPRTLLFDSEKPPIKLMEMPPVKNDDDEGDEKKEGQHDSIDQQQRHASTPRRSKQPVVRVPVGKDGKKDLWWEEDAGRFHESSATVKEKIPLATIFERSLDTVEDAVLHARRIPYEKGWIQRKPHEQQGDDDGDKKIPTIVVLGSGWASHALMKVADTYKIRLIVVSPQNHFVFTPMLASSAVGTVEYRSMTEAIRAANPMIENYIEGKAIDVDLEKRILRVKVEELLEDTRGIGADPPPIANIPYDKLIVAVGCQTNTLVVPGAEKYTYKLKSCDDARKLRSAVGESLEYACRPNVAPQSGLSREEAEERREMRRKRLTWVVVGGGPTGVELAGELSDFVKDITKDRVGSYHKLQGEVNIILVQGASTLVPQFDEENLRQHALETLTEQGVDVRLNTYVNEVGDGWIRLQKKGSDELETIDFGLSVWAAGIAPVPFIDKLLSKLPDEARGPNGRVNVDQWLRCPTKTPQSFGSVLVMGDAAAFVEGRPNESEGQPTFLPQTAQVAAQQGAFVARMLDRGYDLSVTPPVLVDDREAAEADTSMEQDMDLTWLKVRGLEEAPGFKFLNLGILAYLGEGKALSQIRLGNYPIGSYAGSVAFMLWRSVYLVKQVATRNRILVLFDWAKCKIFGRDITRL